ncbi:hypothetical protein F5Y13DRAFT_185367 [Hypoxylon sp. FL1857]|nr:hypothetical protein F5Y13DRAFT_185367 [Hypoxylon sp. FL1857]
MPMMVMMLMIVNGVGDVGNNVTGDASDDDIVGDETGDDVEKTSYKESKEHYYWWDFETTNTTQRTVSRNRNWPEEPARDGDGKTYKCVRRVNITDDIDLCLGCVDLDHELAAPGKGTYSFMMGVDAPEAQDEATGPSKPAKKKRHRQNPIT